MKSKILIITIFLLKVYVGTAQVFTETDKVNTQKNIKDNSFSPANTGSLSNFSSNVVLSSFYKEGVNGKINLQGNFKNGWSGGITLDQKINNTVTKATPLTLSGISPGTTVELNLKKLIWNNPTFKLSDTQVQNLNNMEQAYATKNGIADWHTLGLLEIYNNGNDAEKKAAREAYNTIKKPVFINAKLGFTKTSFAYATDSFTLQEYSNAFVTPTLTVSLIKILSDGFKINGYWALSYNYSQTYTAADDVTFNIPFGRTGNTYASTLAFGKPEKTTSNNIIAEYRRNILIQNQQDNSTNLAISPSAVFDIDNKILGIFLPIYFIKGSDEKGKLLDALQAGIRLGYITSTNAGQFSSFKNGFTAQIMISQPLDFLKKLL